MVSPTTKMQIGCGESGNAKIWDDKKEWDEELVLETPAFRSAGHQRHRPPPRSRATGIPFSPLLLPLRRLLLLLLFLLLLACFSLAALGPLFAGNAGDGSSRLGGSGRLCRLLLSWLISIRRAPATLAHHHQQFPLPGASANPVSVASAVLLYAASYAGAITTLELTFPSGQRSTHHAHAHAHLTAVASSAGCAPNPSWLTLDRHSSVLYCAGEGLDSRNGSLSSFRTSPNGTLLQLDKIDTLDGPVSSVVYGNGDRGLAVAEYSSSSFSSYSITDPESLVLLQSETFTLPRPGPDPERQDVPHPHEAVLDPTGRFLVVPDLGADLVRVFSFDEASLAWTPAELPTLEAAPGSGPRHAVFVVTAANRTFMYLLAELANTVTGYEVSYDTVHGTTTLGFRQVYVGSTHGVNEIVPQGAAAAEIQASPDSKFVIVSSRSEASFTIPAFDDDDDGDNSNSNNGKGASIPSDALITSSIDPESGALTAVQNFPAGGMVPRHFSVSRAGDLLAVGLQHDGRVVIVRRDVTTGLLVEFVAHTSVPGGVSCVVFDE